MSRTLRIPLALLAVALTVGGALIGRFGAAHALAGVIGTLASLKTSAPADLEAGLADVLRKEVLGEALLGAGLVLFVILGARIARASTAFTVAAALVAAVSVATTALLPVSRLPAMAYLRAPSGEWPYGMVNVDKQFWNVFIVRTPKEEWAVTVERSAPVGPEGLKNTLNACFARYGKRPVRVYLDMSCPDDIQKVFVEAAKSACDPLALGVDQIPLPLKENRSALLRIRREEQLAPYREVLQFGIIAHLAAAGALALVVWWTPRNLRGAGLVTGGNLLLAFGEVIALPVALYVAMLPDETGTPEWKRLVSHVKPHLWLTYASTAALILGSLNALVGHVVAPEDQGPEPPRARFRPSLEPKKEDAAKVESAPPPAAPEPPPAT